MLKLVIIIIIIRDMYNNFYRRRPLRKIKFTFVRFIIEALSFRLFISVNQFIVLLTRCTHHKIVESAIFLKLYC